MKGGNRGRFERMLRENVRRAVGRVAKSKVVSAAGRILVETDGDGKTVQERAARVCGVAHVLRVRRMPRELAAVGAEVTERVLQAAPKTFRISTKRSDKTFPLTSVDVNREVGAIVHESTGIPVRLKHPDMDVLLSVQQDAILVGYDKLEGPGGLPVGTGGRVAVLMSGGIDSPVAAWRMMNRGCRCDLVHFHSHPLVDRTTQEKARDLAELLTEWQFRTRLHLVPLARIQTEVRVNCPDSLRVILYRRFMMRIAEVLARKRRCGALVTGESLGQVASQTLQNLATVDAVSTLPILRPLIGTDKQEIVNAAMRMGTYEVSIQPDQDCCQLFIPRRPATRSTAMQATEAEAALDVDALVQDAIERTEHVDFTVED